MKRNYKSELEVANEELELSKELNRTWQKRYEDLALEHAKLQNTEKALKKRMQLKNEEIDLYAKEVKELMRTNEDLARNYRPKTDQIIIQKLAKDFHCKFCEDTGLDLRGDYCIHCDTKY